jgi:MFS family permease
MSQIESKEDKLILSPYQSRSNPEEETLFSNSGEGSSKTGELEEAIPSKSYVLLAILCAVNLLANSAYSSIAPFYPTEAISKGVPESIFGLVFSSYSIAMVIFAPMYAKLLYNHGCRTVLTMGCISEGIAMLIFGTFHFIDNPATFACCSIFCRFLEGFGNGCLNSGSQKLVMVCFPESKLAKMTGILQTFTGLGMLCGPVFGSLLYAVGGF